jgi:hypothetical protein
MKKKRRISKIEMLGVRASYVPLSKRKRYFRIDPIAALKFRCSQNLAYLDF